MGRRRFDHLILELSLACGRRLDRYALWLHFHERGCDPERLDRNAAIAFCRGPARAYLVARGLGLTRWAERRLYREVARFDPELPIPEELLAHFEEG